MARPLSTARVARSLHLPRRHRPSVLRPLTPSSPIRWHHATIPSIPPTMLAAQITAHNAPHQIRSIPTPSPSTLAPHSLLLKVAVSSLCHSDLEYLSGALPSSLPVTASHEGTGTVLAAGAAVTAFAPGDRVMAGQTFDRCGACADCLGPEPYRHYCEFQGPMMSTTRDGAFQEYLVVDARQAVRLPDAMSFVTAAPLACAGVTMWRALLNAGVKAGGWVGIVGSGGGLGHLGVQFARAMGLRVVGVDAREEALELTREVGAEVVVDARAGREGVVRQVMERTEGRGVDATVVVSGAKEAAGMGCAMTRRHGTMVYVPVGHEVCIPFEELIFRDVRVRGSFLCSPKEAEDMLEAVVKHEMYVKSTIFHGIEEVPKVVEQLREGQYQGKGVVVVDKELAER